MEAVTKNLVFQTTNSSLYQCDSSDSFHLCFFGDDITFRACEFIAFKRKLQQLDITKLFESDTPDIEIFYMPHCDRILALSTREILELRELLAGSFAMLELNSLIHKEIIRKRT